MSIARTFRVPTLSDLSPRRYVANNNGPLTPDTEGNPGLTPELAWGFDAGYERKLSAGDIIAVNVYSRTIEDVIVKNLIQRNGIWILRPENSGTARAWGVELESKTKLRYVVPGANLRVNMARNWSKVYSVPGPNNRLDSQSPFTAYVSVDHAFTQMPLSVGAGMRFTSSSSTRYGGGQLVEKASARTYESYVSWQPPAQSWQMRASFSNITRADSSSSTHFSNASGAQQRSQREAGFITTRLSVEIKL